MPGTRRTPEPWYRFAVIVIKPLVKLLFRLDFAGQDRIPRAGGVIVAVNHVSYSDPFHVALFVHDAKRRPRFMAKASLFRLPFAKWVLRGAKQIPVFRESADATHALSAAVDAVRAGECVMIYPEGTVTRDPAYWPMSAKTGVARVALATGAPVIPVAQWGAQHVLGRDQKPHLFPRKLIRIKAGPPVDLSAYEGKPLTAELLREVTNAVMRDIAALVGELRGETPPSEVFVYRRQAS